MNTRLKNKLRKKYPKLLGNANIIIGDGWYWLLNSLLTQLYFSIEHNSAVSISVVQVKSKFGMLRFVTGIVTQEQYGAIKLAESMSTSICEECGSHDAKLRTIKGWKYTLCKSCLKDLKINIALGG